MDNKCKEMSDKELRAIAKQRSKKKSGCYTSLALAAQRELWDRFSWTDREYGTVDNGYIDKETSDLQYNGK